MKMYLRAITSPRSNRPKTAGNQRKLKKLPSMFVHDVMLCARMKLCAKNPKRRIVYEIPKNIKKRKRIRINDAKIRVCFTLTQKISSSYISYNMIC